MTARILLVASLATGIPATSGSADEAPADPRRAALLREISDAQERRGKLLERLLGLASEAGAHAPDGDPARLEAGRLDFHRARHEPPVEDRPADAFEHALVAGPWDWSEELLLHQWTLDLNEDGNAEELRFFAPATGALLRRHLDEDLDGRMDTWITYLDEGGLRRELDADGDGQPEVTELYVDGVVVRRDVDRDRNGIADAWLLYRNDWLAEEYFDPDNDGVADMVVFYDRGELKERHHDVDGDGQVDVVSFYEDGKLVRREIRAGGADEINPEAVSLP